MYWDPFSTTTPVGVGVDSHVCGVGPAARKQGPLYTCIHIYIHLFIYIYTYIHIYIHLFIYIYILWLQRIGLSAVLIVFHSLFFALAFILHGTRPFDCHAVFFLFSDMSHQHATPNMQHSPGQLGLPMNGTEVFKSHSSFCLLLLTLSFFLPAPSFFLPAPC